MIELGTHNSITGYKGKGILSKLLTPFARCQTKSVNEQFNCGVRYFDIRIKYYKNKFVLCHGLWIADVSINCIFDTLNYLGRKSPIYVDITLETDNGKDKFFDYVVKLKNSFNYINIARVNYKKPNWECIHIYNIINTVNRFITLDKSSWHTYIPIPWLWNKIYKFENIDNTINIKDFV